MLPIRKTAQQPPMQAAADHPGVIYECNQPTREDGCQWAAFCQNHLVGYIIYDAQRHVWSVRVVRCGFVRHRSQHAVYGMALAALQAGLSREAALPFPRRLLH